MVKAGRSQIRGSARPIAFRALIAGTVSLCLGSCVGKIDLPAGTAGPAGTGAAGDPGAGGGSSILGTGAGSGGPASGGTGNGASPGTNTGGVSGGGGGAAGTGGPPLGQVTAFACDASAPPPLGVLRRLTMVQYRNTLTDLLTWALGSASAGATMMNELATPLGELPVDHREIVPQDLHGTYRRLDQSLQQLHVDATYDVAVAAAAALTTPARIGTVVGACAADSVASNDATCLDAFVRKFGARALRRPLTSDEVDFYKSAYGATTTADPGAYADLIGVLLAAPEFLYFVEHGDAAVPGQSGVYQVSAYELASRLSYQLWQTAPDDALLQTAADGTLLTSDVYDAQITRMLADPRARPALDEFFSDWMKVDELPALDAKDADPVFKAFAGADLPDANLRQAMIDDVVGLLDYHTWTQPSGITSLFTTELSFARDARLAKLYGVPVWSGTSAPPSLPAGQRPGLLTRGLFLTTGTANTRPIMKGVFIRKTILCNDIPPPPPGANAKPPELGPGMTTRQSVEAITQMPGTVCAGCHATLINPLGFATEDFDALGRFRTEQRLFDASGNQIGTKAIDTTSIPQVRLGDQTPISGPADLMNLVVGSGQVEACVARNFFRFTYGRWEDPTTDGCALEDSRKSLVGGGKVTDLLRAALRSAEFQRRTFQ